MANWNDPTITSDYLDVLDELKARDEDLAKMFDGTGTNIPTGSIRWANATLKFQKWNGASYDDLILSLAGGGTGSATASGARTNLGLGTMAVQNSNSVTITGGSISGITLDAAVITTGVVALARGGTGVSLALGAAGTVLMSFGGAVAFRSGADISNLSASTLTSGTVPLARLVGITNTEISASAAIVYSKLSLSNSIVNADINSAAAIVYSKLSLGNSIVNADINTSAAIAWTKLDFSAAGLLPTARLGSGSADSSVFLRGDQTWTSIPSGMPSGLIGLWEENNTCPSGYTRTSSADGKYLRSGSTVADGGVTSFSGTGDAGTSNDDAWGSNGNQFVRNDSADALVASGNPNLTHGHSVYINWTENTLPAYRQFLLCKKD